MAKRSNIVLLDDNILLYQILPRLPVRSLGCFRCVCKQWRSLLTTPEFTKMHLHQANNQNHPKQLLVPTTKPCKYFRTIDCETPEDGLSANRSFPFQANSNEMSILASLNGLVCVGIDSFQPGSGRYKHIILWNPLTGEYKTLPMDNFHLKAHAIGFGLYYSSSDDDYKLLRVTIYKDAFIYSLKSNSWRKVESTRGRRLLKTKYWNSSCLLNEDLYFLERSINNMYELSYSIIRFDTDTEKFTEIAAPSLQDVAKWRFSLTVVSGCVYLCASSKANCWDKLALWKMDGDGGWTKVVSCCRRLSMRGVYQPLHLMKNGNWLVGSRGEGAYEVDMKMKTTKRVCNNDGPMHILWGGKFVETIVSLNK